MASSGMLRRVALVITDVSEEFSATIIRVTIGELGTLAVTSNRRTLLLYFFAIFLVVPECSQYVNRRFEGTYRLHHQD
jgi:hypothetical protein